MEDKKLTEFLGHYSPEVQELIHQARTMLASELPGVQEIVDIPSNIIAYGYTPKYKDLVCAIAPYKGYINLIFGNGTLLSDPEKILTGTGKRARHVKIQKLNDVDKPEVAELVREAEMLTRNQ